MLVLSRNRGESIILYTSDGPIEVTYWTYDRGRIQLTFDAPLSVRILRKESINDHIQARKPN
jgi:carbon storage regulator CsrA